MKKILKKIIPAPILKKIIDFKNLYITKYAIKSYSQYGEDLIIKPFLNKDNGFYIDIGAHHPFLYSNTYFFYKKNWRGINIDAMPGSMKLFNKFRPKDINLEKAISFSKEKKKYFIFNEPALNTFSEEVAKERNGKKNYKIVKIVEIETATLKEILDTYLPLNTEIDFMNIDVEGYDFEVLKSNDWDKYKPKIILIEIGNNNLEEILNNPIVLYLKEKGYILFAKTFITAFFKLKEF